MIQSTKKLLFTFSFIVSSLFLASCNKEEPEPAPTPEPEPAPLVVDSLKNGLLALNSTTDYTMKSIGTRIAKHTRIYKKDSICVLFDDNKSSDKIYYQDGDKGVYSIGFNGEKYVGSSYYNDISNDVWSGKFFTTLKDVETDYIKNLDASITKLKILNKKYKTEFLKSVGYSAADYVDLDDLTASFNDGKVYFKMIFRNLDINFVYSNFGTSTNTVLDDFLKNGGGPYVSNKNFDTISSFMKSNNYEQYIYQFGETEETTGYVGKNYFHENYFYTNYFNSLLAYGYVALDGRQSTEYKDVYGCYPCTIDYNDDAERPLVLSPICYYEYPDIPTLMNYPSKMSIWNHMEFLCDWNTDIFDPDYDYELTGTGYVITNPALVYEIQDNFAIRTSFEGAVPYAVGIDYIVLNPASKVFREYYICILCKFILGGYTYTMPFMFANFGNVDNPLLNAAIDQIKG